MDIFGYVNFYYDWLLSIKSIEPSKRNNFVFRRNNVDVTCINDSLLNIFGMLHFIHVVKEKHLF